MTDQPTPDLPTVTSSDIPGVRLIDPEGGRETLGDTEALPVLPGWAEDNQSAYTSTREACLADAAWDEHPVPVTEAAWHDHVRPAGWANAAGSLDVEDIDDDYVQVLWRIDGRQPDGATVFHRTEWVLVK